MLNILPQEQKSILKKDYSRRRIVAWLGLVSVCLFVSLVMLLPSYFISKVKADEAQKELEHSKQVLDTQLQSSDVTAEVTAAIKNAEDLKPFSAPTSVYKLMKIFEGKPKTIVISQISFSGKGAARPVITLSGKAADRESLTTFAHELEGHTEFSSVDLPVSNFAKEQNIDFSMTITVK